MTRVLVTGAGGFLGRHLVRILRARGDSVIAFDLAYRIPLEDVDDSKDRPDVTVVRGSVTDRSTVTRAIADCDAVIHCAAITSLWSHDSKVFDRVNVEGTRIVLEEAYAAGIVRMVYVSSFVTLIDKNIARSIIGKSQADWVPEIVDESLELPVGALTGPYPRSKRRAELLCRSHAMDPAIVLPTAPIGPGDHALTPPMWMLSKMVAGKLRGLIDCHWNFVDIRDLAEGVIAAMDRGRGGRRYLIGGANMTTEEMVELFNRIAPRPAPHMRVDYRIALAAALAEATIGLFHTSPPTASLTGVRLAGAMRKFDLSRARVELGHMIRDPEETFRAAVDWLTRED